MNNSTTLEFIARSPCSVMDTLRNESMGVWGGEEASERGEIQSTETIVCVGNGLGYRHQ
jgi:hypothetical protein